MVEFGCVFLDTVQSLSLWWCLWAKRFFSALRPLLLFKTGWYRLLLGVEGELLRHLDIPRNVHFRRRRLLPRFFSILL